MRIMAIDFGDARTGIAVSDLMNIREEQLAKKSIDNSSDKTDPSELHEFFNFEEPDSKE